MRKGHRGGRVSGAKVEGNGMKCSNCGSTIYHPGSKVCGVCSAYQPRLRRKAYIVIILILAWFAFEFSPFDYALYTVPVTIAVTIVLIIAWEVRAMVKERNNRCE